jgi:hypothetical protein
MQDDIWLKVFFVFEVYEISIHRFSSGVLKDNDEYGKTMDPIR